MKKIDKKRFFENYLESAIVQKEIVSRLMERLSLISISPEKIVDIGSGIGLGTKKLKELYLDAEFYMFDKSFQSLNLEYAGNKSTFLVCGDFTKTSFKDNAFDFVYSSSALHWDLDVKSSFEEMYRILKPGGLLLFSTYGPDTLIELRSAWAQVDDGKHVNEFYDMHDLGDLMLALNFIDTVVDSEKIIIDYDNVKQLQVDLKNIGSHVTQDNKKVNGLLSKNKMKLMYMEYEKFKNQSGSLPATYEVIYGSAWKKFNVVSLNN